MDTPQEEEGTTLEIVLSGHDLLRLERGETVNISDVSIRVDHSSVQDYPVGDATGI